MLLNDVKDHDSALEYLKIIGAHPSEIGQTTRIDEDTKERYNTYRRITKFVKAMEKRGVMLDDAHLARDLSAKLDATDFGDLVPNDYMGPLSLEQKEYIRDNLAHIDPQRIATYVLTNYQNVRLAQQGRFSASRRATANQRWQAPPPPEAPIVDLSSNRPFGPLTLEDKIEIYDKHQNTKIVDLAKVYNTSTTNIINAKAGRFKRPADKPTTADSLTKLLSLAGKGHSIIMDGIERKLDDVFNELLGSKGKL